MNRFLLGLGVLPLALSGCSGNYTWAWYVVSPTHPQGQTNLQFLLAGLQDTLLLAVTANLLSILIGLLVALPGLSRNPQARAFNQAYVEIFRSVPVLVMILWVYYGLPVMIGLSLESFTAGMLALAICDSAFEAEIFRAGIQSIERGQHDAANSLGLNYWQRMRWVILPQAIKRVLPAIGNQFVYMIKMSSLVSVIGMTELTRRANELVVSQYRPLEIYTFLVFEYFVLILLVSQGVRWLERRMRASEGY
ncbi:MAG: amino acid ABC transporter permease [bacterium]